MRSASRIRKAPRIWRVFGSALPFQIRLTQTKQVLPPPNEHGSQVKDQGQRQCCHTKHKNFPIGLHVIYLYFPVTPFITQYLVWASKSVLSSKSAMSKRLFVKVKIKLSLSMTIRRMGSGGLAPFILNLDSTLGGGEWPMSLISVEQPTLHTEYEAGWTAE
jgi:hypothetical protein